MFSFAAPAHSRWGVMKKSVLLALFTRGLLVVAAVALCGQAWSAEAEDSQTLTGEFEWTGRGAKGDLEAVFQPTSEGQWDVTFHFTFRGRSHVYAGTAEGSLSDGALKGTVQNEGRKRTFTFSGAFENGMFRGTHAEIEGDREQATGTLRLKG